MSLYAKLISTQSSSLDKITMKKTAMYLKITWHTEGTVLCFKTHLLCFQRQLNEDLLKLFIDKVDAELFKSIFLKGWVQNQQ